MLVQLGNKSLSGQDKATANGYYKEATELARKSATAAPTDAVSKNLLLSALIGLSQTSEDKAVRDEAVAMGKTMMADGTIDAVNKPSIEIMPRTASCKNLSFPSADRKSTTLNSSHPRAPRMPFSSLQP